MVLTIPVDLTIDQGSDWSDSVDFSNDDGTGINLTGYQFQGSIKTSYYSNTSYPGLVVTVLNAAAGNTLLSINAASSANLSAGSYIYNVLMTDTFGNKTNVLGGIITVRPNTLVVPPNGGLPSIGST